MASINYRVEAFQNAGVDAQSAWKFAQVYHTHKFFGLIRSILGEPGGISTVSVVQGWFSGRNRDHGEMSWRTGCCSALISASPCLCPLCMSPMRSRSGSCSKCSSAEAETDSTPVCFTFAFHSSFAMNTACAPFKALILDCYSAPYGRLKQAKVLKQWSLRYAFVREGRVLCLFIYELYTCAAPGECVASDNDLITWFIYGLLLGSLPNTTWFSCGVEHGALFCSSRLWISHV